MGVVGFTVVKNTSHLAALIFFSISQIENSTPAQSWIVSEICRITPFLPVQVILRQVLCPFQ